MADQSDGFYEVRTAKILFARSSLPPRFVVQTGSELAIPSGRYVMALTPIPAKSRIRKVASYRLAWPVTGVGKITAHIITFRSKLGYDYNYNISDGSSWIGCFYRYATRQCKTALIAHYRITSSRQQRVFEKLLALNPFAGLLWTEIARTSSRAFPTVLCSDSVRERCASLDVFEKMIDFHPGD
jgi:hypothetical protein